MATGEGETSTDRAGRVFLARLMNSLHEGRATSTALLLLLFRRVEGVAVAPVDGSVLELAQRGRAPLAEALFAAVVVGAAGIPFSGEVENRFFSLDLQTPHVPAGRMVPTQSATRI